MAPAWSRRAFLGALPLFASAQIPPESKRTVDPATEFEILRLTDPARSNCYLPPQPLRCFGRGDSLLYCSDRYGAMQAYRMDLGTGESEQITQAVNLDRATAGFLPDGRNVLYFDGRTLRAGTNKARDLYAVAEGWQRFGSFAVAQDGNHAFFVETDGKQYRLRMVGLRRPAVSTVVESAEPIYGVRPRTRRAGVLYWRDDGLYLVNYDGAQNRKLRTADGLVRQALWTGDGRTAVYLNAPRERGLPEIRECTPDSNEDKLIGRTSVFLNFAINGDASVFAGVSGNKGSPHILLLVRAAARELTVAEHKATDPSSVVVSFAPNSQRLYYHTDREGKTAIYSIGLERLVEQTEISATYERHSWSEARQV
jgi:oligogalacturonide lyase